MIEINYKLYTVVPVCCKVMPSIFSGSDDKLVLITKRYQVGKLRYESPIYRIEKIAIVPLSLDGCPEIDFHVG